MTDQQGHICATAIGKTKEGLAELIRIKLLPVPQGVRGTYSVSYPLDQLRREFPPCPSLTVVRDHYFAHIHTNRHLIKEIRAGLIPLKYTRLLKSLRANPVVFLSDLANYLDAQAPKLATRSLPTVCA